VGLKLWHTLQQKVLFVYLKNAFFEKQIFSCEISGSHGGEYEEDSLKGYSVV
jgi:hypothetical protein